MQPHDKFDSQIRGIHDKQVDEYFAEVKVRKAREARLKKASEARQQQHREYLKSIGVKLDQVLARDKKADEKDLAQFLEDERPALVSRPSQRAADAKLHALQSAAYTEAGHLILPPYAGTIVSANPDTIAGLDGESGSGWIFPSDPSKIKFKEGGHGADSWCLGAIGGGDPPVFTTFFSFVPNQTATYEMTAVFAFHGFYILRAHDRWYNCKWAKVKLHVEMNVNQYADIGVQSFPLLEKEVSDSDTITAYDRTNFFDYTTVLKQGDPVSVRVSIIPETGGRGSDSFAELNFEAGNANFILPLLLSVHKL